MSRRLIAALAAAVTLALGACGGVSGTNDGGYISGNGQVAEIAPGHRGKPVELSGDAVGGGTVDLADLRGKPVVINVWWSGCGPCASEMPMLQKLSKRLGKRAGFVGINIRDNAEAQSEAFERRFGITYPSIYSPNGRAVLAFDGDVSPRSMPSTIVLDPKGRVATVVRGPIPSERTLIDVLEAAGMAGKTGTSG